MKTRIASALFAACLALAASCPSVIAGVEHVRVAPVGEYAKIDTRLAKDTIAALGRGPADARARAIADIRLHPENYAPPVFYALSRVLFDEGKQDDGAFWFYAGQIRARFDARRCADSSAGSAVAALNEQFGTPINQYMFKDLPKLEALIPRVVEWDRTTPHHYDQRWINLHGMNAMMTGLEGAANDTSPLSVPESQWDALAETNRIEYLKGFRQVMANLHQQK